MSGCKDDSIDSVESSEILLGSDPIEHVELGADTVVVLSNGSSFVVKESANQILEEIIEFGRRLLTQPVNIAQQVV